ncbi:MAG: 4-hydroxy-tetrahydrodipicolinate synthase [Oscillospiraceae bacterium]|nr:4-hydroxy-tetrahydrodipicolinate synthase [Oscillospiraceae bacterium]MDD4367966.1 4-hydroxy-tetrahydrodipicolinate synthase [Oscillospiraceae bacterium]
MKAVFKGSAVALVTPFKNDQVDYERLDQLCDEQIAAGTDALVICGTTGEASAMPDDEHISVIREAVRVTAGRVPVIAGTGSNDTRHGAALSQAAAKAGADALLCVTPYYNKTSQKGLIQHFTATAAAVDLPIILYNVPSRTSLNIQPQTYAALADVENIVGIKECNLGQVGDIFQLTGDRFAVYSGEDGLVLPLMALGGLGVISVIANIVPQRTVAMTHAWLNGDIQTARAEQISLLPLIHACFCDVNPIPIKAAMNLLHKAVGPCRLPLTDLSEADTRRLQQVLKDYALLA